MADYDTLISRVQNLLYDTGATGFDAEVIYWSLDAAIARYSQINARTIMQCFQLTAAGIWAQPLTGWTGDALQEVVYLHWPAHSTIPTTVDKNRIVDWWYYNHGSKPSAVVETVYVDLMLDSQVGVTALPAATDYIMVSGVCKHRINGMGYEHFTDTASTYSTIPKNHFALIALGAAGYACRSREIGFCVTAGQSILVPPGDPLAMNPFSFLSSYHIGVLADSSDRYMRDFEAELYLLSQKKLDRPIWGDPERRRLQRLTEIGGQVPRPKSR
jgi:hypothetical protein